MKINKDVIDFTLDGDFSDDENQVYCYADYRQSSIERGPFYFGIGNSSRVKRPRRQWAGSYHDNTARKYGLLRKFFPVGSWDEACEWEVTEISKARQQGLPLANLTDGGEGTLGLVAIVNAETGETKSWPKGEPYPEGFSHVLKGVNIGKVVCRNKLTGETAQFPVDSIPDGWCHNTKGLFIGISTYRNPKTGESARFKTDSVPEGWVHFTKGQNSGKVVCRNPETGDVDRFNVDSVPDGWVHITKDVNLGMVVCRHELTGETARFPAESIPVGWTGVRRGHVTCKNPLTGEVGSFKRNEIPSGWVGITKGDKAVSESIAATWDNPEIRARRSAHRNVICNGERYKSVAAVFKMLGAPSRQAERFRTALGIEKNKTFLWQGKEYHFSFDEK